MDIFLIQTHCFTSEGLNYFMMDRCTFMGLEEPGHFFHITSG